MQGALLDEIFSPYYKRCSKDCIAISRPSFSAIANSVMPNIVGA
jgi:hypothetical protein